MTETKKYPHPKYIPHFVVIRLIVLGPVAITHATAEFISNSLEKFMYKLDEFLPPPY
jgi:hypothetical protein